MARVSIVIPAYNPGPFLEATLKSVASQTFRDWELILVDDGSTHPIILPNLDLHECRIIRQENQGLSGARNTGIVAASGEFVAFLDADDLWRPTKLQRQLALMDCHPEMGLCHTYQDEIDETGRKTADGFSADIPSYRELLRHNCICVSTVMVRRSILDQVGHFSARYRSVQDYDLWLRIIREGTIGFIPTCEASYRRHSANMSGNAPLMLRETLQILHSHAVLARQESCSENLKAIREGIHAFKGHYARAALESCRGLLQRKDWFSLLYLYFWALYEDPTLVRRRTLSFARRKLHIS